MSKQIFIKNKLYEELENRKGNGSFSEALENIMKKAGIVIPDTPARGPRYHNANQPIRADLHD